METAARKTAFVSKQFFNQTASNVDVLKIVEKDKNSLKGKTNI
ncbi:hypothetical protein [Methanosarcina sp.]